MNRHGDVQLTRVSELPKGAKFIENRKELAFGEATGHAHRVKFGDLFQTENGVMYLKTERQDELTHEEHIEKLIEPGIYRVGIKRQYTSDGSWTKVID